jgi:hypothetical protein
MVCRGQEEEISCLQCGYVEYHSGEAGGNGSSGPAAVAEIQGENGQAVGWEAEAWISEGARILSTLVKERDRRKKELDTLDYKIRSMRWRVGEGFSHYWSPEKRAAQAERMRAMNKVRVRKGVRAAIAT